MKFPVPSDINVFCCSPLPDCDNHGKVDHLAEINQKRSRTVAKFTFPPLEADLKESGGGVGSEADLNTLYTCIEFLKNLVWGLFLYFFF